MSERHWKQRSIYNKLLFAAADKRINDSFVWFSDDHFLLKPFSPNYNYHSSLENAIANFTIHESYRRTIANTYKVIPGGMHYGHGPMVFETDLFARAMAEVTWSLHWGYAIKSLYCYFNDCRGQQQLDVKINKPLSRLQIIEKVSNSPYFSTGDNGINENMIAFLESIYPDKSIYELQ